MESRRHRKRYRSNGNIFVVGVGACLISQGKQALSGIRRIGRVPSHARAVHVERRSRNDQRKGIKHGGVSLTSQVSLAVSKDYLLVLATNADIADIEYAGVGERIEHRVRLMAIEG